MWCEQCQSDVATEISSDGQQLLCTTCGQPVRKVVAPSLHPETKSAREFLERWAREQQGLKAQPVAASKPVTLPENADPITPVDVSAPVSAGSSKPESLQPIATPPATNVPAVPVQPALVQTAPVVEQPAVAESTPPVESRKKLRLDTAHAAPDGPVPARREQPRRPHHLERVPETVAPPASAPAPTTPPVQPIVEEAVTAKKREAQLRLDDAETLARGPHFDVRSIQPQRTVYPGRSEAMWGQLLAYAGVGLLTVGTVLVLWGYFGEIEQYASTGWLITTAGQMLLLLGIVTLVGGGMQQTTHEVTQRIENLGGRIIRIEESTDMILKGPHFNRARRRTRKKTTGEQDAA